MFVRSVVIFMVAITASHGITKLPSYIKQCSGSDPKINECFVKNANLAIPSLLNGDKKLKVPNLVPLNIDEVKINPSDNLRLTMKKIQIFGLDEAKVMDAKVDLEKMKIQMTVFIPHVTLLGDYNIKGTVTVLPIEGSGPCNITLVDGHYVYNLDLQLIEKKGAKFAKVKDHNIVLDAKKIYYRLDNLFNGNKQLSDQMNQFLNENSREVSRDLSPAVTETVSVIITSIIKAVLNIVPWDNVILP